MNSLKTFIFPDTDPFRETRYPLLLLCAPLVYLQPVEANPDRPGDANEPDLFTERGLCQAHTPAPLGADRDRFQRLINDIRERRDDYAAQLSALTVASLSAPPAERSEEARHQIVSSLLGQHGLADDIAAKTATLERWQARLVLAIAEMLEKEEEALRADLELLSEREMDMLRSLQGEDGPEEDNPLAELEKIRTRLATPRPGSFTARFKAWLKLMRAAEPPQTELWLASSMDAADQVFEALDEDRSPGAVPVLTLSLPQAIAASPRYVIEQIEQFHHQAAEVLAAIATDLASIRERDYPAVAQPEDLLPTTGGSVERWSALLDQHFPASSHGRSSLTFYLLPGHSIPSLLSLAGASPDEERHPHHGLLAVLHD
ncbi:hypothetical protein [Desulfofustis glycolicus]|uniref:Uncharacterized protein n=1 Tax=Desulfofustis glycolicus DSM 9705 TaxID=1121409 RepID=A0A1M5VUJ6_9BACT|nr:hypothetical protein [Desulfofustis glycolicus]SHH78926.1 hypothetical protein SAMN02745124_01930 [Desulfofustis glycolicus DSM 9705]